MTGRQLDVDSLRQFQPLQKLNEQQLILLATKHDIKEFKKSQKVIAAGSSDNIEYFLLAGKLRLTAGDGRSMIIEANTEKAKNPIAHLQPRQYQVEAVENSRLLLIDWSILAQFMREAPKMNSRSEDAVNEFNSSKEIILNNFREDLKNNTISFLFFLYKIA